MVHIPQALHLSSSSECVHHDLMKMDKTHTIQRNSGGCSLSQDNHCHIHAAFDGVQTSVSMYLDFIINPHNLLNPGQWKVRSLPMILCVCVCGGGGGGGGMEVRLEHTQK